jgi:hypothetical protein
MPVAVPRHGERLTASRIASVRLTLVFRWPWVGMKFVPPLLSSRMSLRGHRADRSRVRNPSVSNARRLPCGGGELGDHRDQDDDRRDHRQPAHPPSMCEAPRCIKPSPLTRVDGDHTCFGHAGDGRSHVVMWPGQRQTDYPNPPVGFSNAAQNPDCLGPMCQPVPVLSSREHVWGRVEARHGSPALLAVARLAWSA